MSGNGCIEVERDGRVAVIWLNRPEAGNRLNRRMIGELKDAAASLERDPSIGAAVVAARGDVFCAGGDMGDYALMSVGEIRDFWAACIDLYVAMNAFAKPLIAAVDGPVEGGGFTLFDAADLAVATPRATFSAPEVKAGLAPIVVAVAVGRSLGRRKALELFLGGGELTADEAEKLGLINRLVPPGRAVPEAVAMARAISGHNPLAVGLCKRLYRSCFTKDYRDHLERALDVLISMLKSEDGLESARARRENRPPRWTGR